MSIEAAAVIAKDGTVIHWHNPPGRSSVAIPDSQDLWDIVWENRHRIDGIAHTHPGSGFPAASSTDLTTFAAMEAGLGLRIRWWILSLDCSVVLEWAEDVRGFAPGHEVSRFLELDQEPPWTTELRRLSWPKVEWPSR